MFGKPKQKQANPMTWDDDDEPQGYRARPCPVCDGKRKTTYTVRDEKGNLVEVKDWCAACGGTGEA